MKRVALVIGGYLALSVVVAWLAGDTEPTNGSTEARFEILCAVCELGAAAVAWFLIRSDDPKKALLVMASAGGLVFLVYLFTGGIWILLLYGLLAGLLFWYARTHHDPAVAAAAASQPETSAPSAGPSPIQEALKEARPDELPGKTEDLLAELDELVGMTEVKKQVRSLTSFLRTQHARAAAGLGGDFKPPHLRFEGPPGTGKTTVARLVGRIYRSLGLLSGPRFRVVEATKPDFVGEYVGQSEAKTERLVDSALGGVLFIDEAYSLTGDQFADAVVSSLVTRLENDRGKFVCIVAGYPDDLDAWLAKNSGLKSRFPRTISFPAFSPGELVEIAELSARESDYEFNAGAAKELVSAMRALHSEFGGDPDWGNAREVRSLLSEFVYHAHATRVGESTDRAALSTIIKADVESGVEQFRLERSR